VLLTADDVTRRSHYRNAVNTLNKLLELGVVPIVNENDTVATQEIRFGDNDRLAALVAHLVDADLLVLLSDVDALYDGDPSKPGTRPSARCAARGPRGRRDRLGGQGRGRHRRHGDQGRGGPDRHRRGHPGDADHRRARGPGAARRAGRHLFHRTGERGGARRLWLAHATTGAAC
jgi:glutamate 5-kinase